MDRPTAHLDAGLPPTRRAELLLATMTTAEKAAQLTTVFPILLLTGGRVDPGKAGALLEHGLGGLAPYTNEDPAAVRDVLNALQRHVVERTRLGVPLLAHAEALNGAVAARHPIYPTAIALASTWSPDLVERMGDAIRAQMRALGIRQALAPVLDIALDPRWGRVHETYGEDPLLAAAMGVAYVRGLQGKGLRDGVVATAKHFVGYALGQGGLNRGALASDRRFLRDVLALPFEAAVREAGLRSAMNSYGTVDGVPVGISREVLTDLLRTELGFDGFVISDYMTMQAVLDNQRAATSVGQVAGLALHAGLDLEAPYPFAYGRALEAEVDAGRVPLEDLDLAVHRVLVAKFELGLFEQPYAPDGPITIDARDDEHAGLAGELASRSLVLLENDGALPLRPGRRIAVVGPHASAAHLQIANYTHPAFREMQHFMAQGGFGNNVGMDAFLGDAEPADIAALDAEAYVRLRYGTRSLGEELAAHGLDVVAEPGTGIRAPLDELAFDRALEAARGADLVVLALGGYSAAFTSDLSEGEGTDSADIGLPEVQRRLADAVAATGVDTVAVVVQGRPYVLPPSVLASRALVVASFAGQAGTAALADVLAGVVEPGGRLPYSIPRHTGQIPVFHHQEPGSGYRGMTMAKGTHYLDVTAAPLHPFGAGRGWTDFAYADLALPATVPTDGTVAVSFTLTNTGPVRGAEVAQVYARFDAAVVMRPAQQLVGFARVELDPGESAAVTVEVPVDVLAFSGLDRVVSVEAGPVQVFVGGHSDDRRLTGSLVVEGPRRPVGPGRRFLHTARTDRID